MQIEQENFRSKIIVASIAFKSGGSQMLNIEIQQSKQHDKRVKYPFIH